MPTSDKKREDDYRAEEDLRTMERAEEVRGDGARMQACARMHRRKQAAAKRLNRVFSRRGARA